MDQTAAKKAIDDVDQYVAARLAELKQQNIHLHEFDYRRAYALVEGYPDALFTVDGTFVDQTLETKYRLFCG